MKKQIHILATGGTIASQSVNTLDEHYELADVGIDALLTSVPELGQIADIQTEQIAQVSSQYMSEDIWFSLAKRIEALSADDNVDGIVITHGTDTLEETAYFLNLVCHTDKPIVLTGAMRPANALSSDGPKNILSAVTTAASDAAIGKGVLVVLNNDIHAARYVSKTHVSALDAFKSPDFGMLGTIVNQDAVFYQQPTRLHTSQSEFSLDDISSLPCVDIIYGYAFADKHLVKAAVADGVKGIVSAGVGRGYQSAAIQEALHEASQQDIIVVRSSRINGGIINRDPSMDDQYGFVTGDNLNPQKARVLLMLALAKTQSHSTIQTMFQQY
tara:strand:- start:44557 stop:45543 length:987 start_codon:yes stop_codon:yes gene_type:complete